MYCKLGREGKSKWIIQFLFNVRINSCSMHMHWIDLCTFEKSPSSIWSSWRPFWWLNPVVPTVKGFFLGTNSLLPSGFYFITLSNSFKKKWEEAVCQYSRTTCSLPLLCVASLTRACIDLCERDYNRLNAMYDVGMQYARVELSHTHTATPLLLIATGWWTPPSICVRVTEL